MNPHAPILATPEQVTLFCLAIGQDPKDLPLAVVNLEGGPCPAPAEAPRPPRPLGCPVEYSYYEMGFVDTAHLANFTCRYLSFLDRSVARPVYYRSVAEATRAVEHGEAWGVMAVGENFTVSLKER